MSKIIEFKNYAGTPLRQTVNYGGYDNSPVDKPAFDIVVRQEYNGKTVALFYNRLYRKCKLKDTVTCHRKCFKP